MQETSGLTESWFPLTVRHLHDFTERAPEQNLESWDPSWIYYNSPCDFQEVTSHLCAFVSFSPR